MWTPSVGFITRSFSRSFDTRAPPPARSMPTPRFTGWPADHGVVLHPGTTFDLGRASVLRIADGDLGPGG